MKNKKTELTKPAIVGAPPRWRDLPTPAVAGFAKAGEIASAGRGSYTIWVATSPGKWPLGDKVADVAGIARVGE